MSHLFLRIIIFFILIVAVSACKDDSTLTETCFDGIKNQDELDVDCGGVCDKKCRPIMSAIVNATPWEADLLISSYSASSSTFSLTGRRASGVYPSVQLIFTGPLTVGEHTLDASSGYIAGINSFTQLNHGSIIITGIEQIQKVVEGTFSLSCTDNSSGTTYELTNGIFRFVTY